VKVKYYNIGKYCIFDAINYLFCYCFLKKPCRDKCFTPWTIGKWVIYSGYFAALAYFVIQWKMTEFEKIELGYAEYYTETEID
jgi:hypothetical protein